MLAALDPRRVPADAENRGEHAAPREQYRASADQCVVAVVPGFVFGEAGDGHLRVSYATDLSSLKEVMNRIESYVESSSR